MTESTPRLTDPLGPPKSFHIHGDHGTLEISEAAGKNKTLDPFLCASSCLLLFCFELDIDLIPPFGICLPSIRPLHNSDVLLLPSKYISAETLARLLFADKRKGSPASSVNSNPPPPNFHRAVKPYFLPRLDVLPLGLSDIVICILLFDSPSVSLPTTGLRQSNCTSSGSATASLVSGATGLASEKTTTTHHARIRRDHRAAETEAADPFRSVTQPLGPQPYTIQVPHKPASENAIKGEGRGRVGWPG